MGLCSLAAILLISSHSILIATAQQQQQISIPSGTKQQANSNNNKQLINQPTTRLAPSPSAQLRQRDLQQQVQQVRDQDLENNSYQQQREEQVNIANQYVSPSSTPKQKQTSTTTQSTLSTKQLANRNNYDQQQQEVDLDGNNVNNNYQSGSRNVASNGPATTEDPLADSEPALYGSVAGAPGVDFPAYTRIPKTSFTCEGKGYDFGFYADEEAQCQVYHVCWSGRRESFLCGVGTVFNQAILTCDYWHSVDCSKSSQFYSANSELGK